MRRRVIQKSSGKSYLIRKSRRKRRKRRRKKKKKKKEEYTAKEETSEIVDLKDLAQIEDRKRIQLGTVTTGRYPNPTYFQIPCGGDKVRLSPFEQSLCGCIQHCPARTTRFMNYLASDSEGFSEEEKAEEDVTSCWEKTSKFFANLGHQGAHLITITYLFGAIGFCAIWAFSIWPPYPLFYINLLAQAIGLYSLVYRKKPGIMVFDLWTIFGGIFQFLHGFWYTTHAVADPDDRYEPKPEGVGELLCGMVLGAIAPFRMIWWKRYIASIDHFTGKKARPGKKF